MKKILVFSIVFILLIGIVSSSALSTLWKQGVSAANPQAAKVIGMADQIMEIKTITQCATGVGASACMQSIVEQKAMGQVYGEAIKAAGPEVQKVISTYQQLDLYREAGAELIDLKIDEGGEIKGGTIQFSGEKEREIGNLIGKDLKKEDISVKNSKVEIFNEKERENSLSVARITFDEKGASAKIGVNDFSGVMSQEETGKPAYIELDKDGNIVKAEIKTGEKGKTFIFGDVEFDVPPETDVFYDAKSGELRLGKGSEIKEISDFGKGKEITIIGKDVKLPSGVKISGSLSYGENGPFVKRGNEVIIDRTKFLKTNNDVNIYFEKYFDSNKHVGENYYFESDKGFLMNSIEKGEVKVEFLEGNEFFSMDKLEYAKDENGGLIKFTSGDEKDGFLKDDYGFKYKVVPDKKDLLKIIVENGDSLEAKERTERKFLFIGEKRKKIPLLKHSNSENGKTIIENGRSKFLLTDKLDLDTKTFTNQEEFDKIHKGKYQSVAFQLQSDSIPKNYELRIGSNNQFAFLSPDERDARVVFNKYGIGISKYPEELQTIDQLRAKYASRGIDFGLVREPWIRQMRSKDYKEPSPYMIQITGQWLETHPNAKLDYISFTDMDNAMFPDPTRGYKRIWDEKTRKLTRERGIALGERIFDPESNSRLLFSEIDREFDNPLSIITHEYEHLQDDIIEEQDKNRIRNIIDDLLLKPDSNILAQEAFEKAKSKIDINNLGKIYFGFDFSTLDPEFRKQFEKDISVLDNALKILEEENMEKAISSLPAESYSKKYFIKKYSEGSLTKKELISELRDEKEWRQENLFEDNLLREFKSRKDALKKQGTKNAYDITMSEFLKKEKYGNYIKNKIYGNRVEKIATRHIAINILEVNEYKPLQKHYNDIVDRASSSILSDERFQEIYEDTIKILEEEKDNFDLDKKKSADKYLKLSKDYNKVKLESIVFLSQFGSNSPKIDKLYKKMTQYVETEGGLPALYAFRDYGKDIDLFDIQEYNIKGNKELSSTYMEESIEERRQKLHQGTKAQKKIYNKLTQLAFDSEKMSVKEYKQLMGKDFCESKNCCDKKCVIYKLNCGGGC